MLCCVLSCAVCCVLQARGEVRVLLLKHEAAAAVDRMPLLMARLNSAAAQLSAQEAIERFVECEREVRAWMGRCVHR